MDKSSETATPAHGFEEVSAKYRTYFVRISLSYVRDRMAAEAGCCPNAAIARAISATENLT